MNAPIANQTMDPKHIVRAFLGILGFSAPMFHSRGRCGFRLQRIFTIFRRERPQALCLVLYDGLDSLSP